MRRIILILIIISFSCNKQKELFKKIEFNDKQSIFGDINIINLNLDEYSASILEETYNFLINTPENVIIENYIKKKELNSSSRILRLMIFGDLVRYTIVPKIDTITKNTIINKNYKPENYWDFYFKENIYYVLLNSDYEFNLIYLSKDNNIVDTAYKVNKNYLNSFFSTNINEKELFMNTIGKRCFLSIFSKNNNRTVVIHGFDDFNKCDSLINEKNSFLSSFYWIECFLKKNNFDLP